MTEKTKKIKILEVATLDLTVNRFVLPLMNALKQSGFEVMAACKDVGGMADLIKQGFRSFNIHFERRITSLNNVKAFFQLIKLLKEQEIDIIHTHTPFASAIGRLAALFAGTKIRVYTVHGFYFKPAVVYWIEKILCRYLTDFIFTVNKEDLNFALKNGFTAREKILNLNSVGIDVERFNPQNISRAKRVRLVEKFNPNKKRLIGYVGRITREKGVFDLLAAFRDLEPKYNALLVLVGSGDFEERDKNTVKELKKALEDDLLKNRVILTGFMEDIPEILSLLDVFVLPSYREGMPVSLLEAMAMEVPVVATDIRGCREAVDEETGILVPPEDPGAIKKAIEFIFSHPEKARQMGKNARIKVVNKFNQKEAIDKQISVFRAIKTRVVNENTINNKTVS
jgi:glycosyltransferase involved in cell wall biosynthesis